MVRQSSGGVSEKGVIIQHPCVTSDVFKLISTIEFDLEINGHLLPTRLELFQDTERENVFRARMWERDLFRLRPTPHTDEATGEVIDGEEDEELLIERTWELSDEFESFEADSAEAAIGRVLDALKEHLERVHSADRN
jgi:hypothetical protein